MGILFITIVVNSTFLVRNLLLSSFAFTAISSCMMVLSLSLVTTACSLVCCIWFTIALFKKLCTVFFCLFVCFFFHYLCLCIEIAERMAVIQWGSVDRLTVRKICNFFIKYMFFSSCFMFCDVCYWCFICSGSNVPWFVVLYLITFIFMWICNLCSLTRMLI